MKTTDISRPFFLRKVLMVFSLIAAVSFTSAQNNAWDEEDDEDEEGSEGSGTVTPAEDLTRYDEALILIDGKEFTVSPEISVPKDDTIEIAVRHLQPNSRVSVEIKKGGVTLKKTGFSANELGELDLEVRTGGKMSGGATIYYFAGSGKKVQLDVKMKIE